MSYRSCVSLVLAVMASACGASANRPLGQELETAAVATRGTGNLIIRAEFEQDLGRTVWEAVEILRPRWLQPVRSGTFTSGPEYARVVVDQTIRGDLQELRFLVVDGVETMRRLSPSEATTKYGTGYPGGVIEVTTRGR